MCFLLRWLTCRLLSPVLAEVSHHLTRLTAITGISPWVDMEGQHSLSHLHLVTVHQCMWLTLGFGLQEEDSLITSLFSWRFYRFLWRQQTEMKCWPARSCCRWWLFHSGSPGPPACSSAAPGQSTPPRGTGTKHSSQLETSHNPEIRKRIMSIPGEK